MAWGLGLRLAVSLVFGSLIWGCAGRGAEVRPRTSAPVTSASPVQMTVDADWDDVQAAVGHALARTELVRESIRRPSEERIEFRLRSSRDEPGLLVASREEGQSGGGPVPVTLTCTVGRFGDPARERQMLSLVAERLGQLRGVEVAPIKR